MHRSGRVEGSQYLKEKGKTGQAAAKSAYPGSTTLISELVVFSFAVQNVMSRLKFHEVDEYRGVRTVVAPACGRLSLKLSFPC
jgi:hypothetical protein